MAAARELLKRAIDLFLQLVLGLIKRFPLWTAILVIATGAYVCRDRLSGNVTDLKVGDCFDVPESVVTDAVLKGVQHHPCGDPHTAEVIFTGFVPGTNEAYPDDASFSAFARTLCFPAYRDYRGRDYEADLGYHVSTVAPTADGWKTGDRGFTCLIVRADHKPMIGTVRVIAAR
jgi:hypothetical protein